MELIKLANLIITVTKAAACANRIQGVLEIQSSMQAPKTTAGGRTEEDAPAVAFEDVSLTYKGAGGESLTGLRFSVPKGSTVGVIGGTGSGKTSLVNLIPRFYDATKGRVLVDGRDVRDYSLEELRRKVGVVPQKAVLFSGTIRENLLWGNEQASDKELYEALDTAQAREVVANREEGLDAAVEQGGKNFSGGQKQRLTIARALVGNPEILILDDSASALDFATDARLRKALRNLRRKTTVFIVSQRTSSIQHADQIIVLDDGKPAGIGTIRNSWNPVRNIRKFTIRSLTLAASKRMQERRRQTHEHTKICPADETLRKLSRYLKPYRVYLAVSVLLAAVTVALTLYVPTLTGNAIDFILGEGRVDFPRIIRILIQIGVCIAVTALAQWIMNICNNKMTYQMVRDIRNDAFQKIEILPLKYIDSHSYGEVVSRVIADVDQLADGLLMGFTQLFTGIATIAGTLGFMLSINVGITFVVVLITPLSFFVAALLPNEPIPCSGCSRKPAASRPPSSKK